MKEPNVGTCIPDYMSKRQSLIFSICFYRFLFSYGKYSKLLNIILCIGLFISVAL